MMIFLKTPQIQKNC